MTTNLKPSHRIGELSEAEQQAVSMREEGATMKAIMAATNLNHSQAERAIMKATLTEADVASFEAGGTDLGSRAQAGRANGLSWGVMGILAGQPESAVRRAFTQATELKSQGLRIGRGGRFHYDESGRPLYADELKATGTAIPKGGTLGTAIKASFEQRLGRLDRAAVVRIAEQYGIPTKGATQILVKRIIKAAEGVAERNAERTAQLAIEAAK